MSKIGWALIAIDGTESYSAAAQIMPKVSHVFHFFQAFDCPGGHKKYMDGPGLSGRNVRVILSEAEIVAQNIVSGMRREGYDDIRLCVIGWSRGAMIAINLARNLIGWAEVYYMALLDTVDMTSKMDVGTVENVKHVVHLKRILRGSRRWSMAKRHDLELSVSGKKVKPLTVGSRTGLGWLDPGSNTNIEAYFHTSHGGVGGSMEWIKPKWYDAFADHTPWRDQHTLATAQWEERNAYDLLQRAAIRLHVPVRY